MPDDSMREVFSRFLSEIADEHGVNEEKSRKTYAKRDVELHREGKKIILPNDPQPMAEETAVEVLQRKIHDKNTILNIKEEFQAHPLEALVAFNLAMKELYGWASPVPTPGFWGPTPPQMLTIQTDIDEWVQVPYGSFKVPGISERLQTTVNRDKKFGYILIVHGQATKKEQHVLMELAAETRRILQRASIYRGKALQIDVNDKGEIDLTNPPKFLDFRAVSDDELIVNQSIREELDQNVFGPILHTDRARSMGYPLKRGVLLEGPFGVGKSMTARVTAKACVDNGWTFLMVERGTALKEALLFAQRYQPAVVFCEDIDRTTSNRTDGANDLLNTISGIIANDNEIMVVLTTNYVENINQAMLRPGRLDAVISITPPDADSVKQLVHVYARGMLTPGEDLTAVGEELAGQIPALIREVVERSKMGMVMSGRDTISATNLLVAARGMATHRRLLEKKAPEPTPAEQLATALKKVLAIDTQAVELQLDEISRQIKAFTD